MAESTLVNGEAAVAATPGYETFKKYNPRTGEVLYEFTDPSDEEIAAVFDRARAARQPW